MPIDASYLAQGYQWVHTGGAQRWRRAEEDTGGKRKAGGKGHSVYLWDAEQIVEIGAYSGTQKNALTRFDGLSKLIH